MIEADPFSSDTDSPVPVVLTIGTFDGVHLGHQALLDRTVQAARTLGIASAALTFVPHPRAVLNEQSDLLYLMPVERRMDLIRARGITRVVRHPFDRTTAQATAAEFFSQLSRSLPLQRLVVGENFRIGRNRESGVEDLRALGSTQGWDVESLPPFMEEGQTVSSTRIRQVLSEAGDVELASRLLGRSFELSGPVVEGFGRGRSIGVPTANLRMDPDLLVPLNGVYLCAVQLEGQATPTRTGALNIGIRPTFDAGERSVELHILDFEGDLYGQRITVHLLRRLRGERKFESVDALVDQIGRDLALARSLTTASSHG